MTIAKPVKKTFVYLLLLILITWISGYGAFLFYIETLEPKDPEEKTDAIIVLTGGTQRINKGLELYANKMAPKLFISGVHNLVTDSEIRKMWQNDLPLPKCCITLGHDATTTTGNAQEVKKWITDNKIKSIRLVTSSYHMPRAKIEFTHALHTYNAKIILHPVKQKEDDNKINTLKQLKLVFGEYNKTLFRWSVLNLRAWEAYYHEQI
ncbi:MAG: YdcF family protein [Alphaproteobacteria bacterium]